RKIDRVLAFIGAESRLNPLLEKSRNKKEAPSGPLRIRGHTDLIRIRNRRDSICDVREFNVGDFSRGAEPALKALDKALLSFRGGLIVEIFLLVHTDMPGIFGSHIALECSIRQQLQGSRAVNSGVRRR